MNPATSPRARFSATDAERLAETVFGCTAAAMEIESYDDRNFALTDVEGARFVLKVTRPSEDRSVIEAQNSCLEHLAAAGIAAPRPVAATDGRTLVEVAGPDGDAGLARLLTWIPGERMADLPHPPALLEDLGRFLGEMDSALSEFDHPALKRNFAWDLGNTPRVRADLDALPDSRRRERVSAWLDRIESEALPVFAGLRRGVVHNDPNGHNVLVADPTSLCVTGIIDFGDLLHTAVVSDLAIAMAYTLESTDDVFAPARSLLHGYLPRFSLQEREVALLPLLAVARLCMSVVSSARATQLDPTNEYIRISEPQAWGALDRLESDEADRAADDFLDARAALEGEHR